MYTVLNSPMYGVLNSSMYGVLNSSMYKLYLRLEFGLITQVLFHFWLLTL